RVDRFLRSRPVLGTGYELVQDHGPLVFEVVVRTPAVVNEVLTEDDAGFDSLTKTHCISEDEAWQGSSRTPTRDLDQVVEVTDPRDEEASHALSGRKPLDERAKTAKTSVEMPRPPGRGTAFALDLDSQTSQDDGTTMSLRVF